MQPLLNIATKAARQAGDIIARCVERLDTLEVTVKMPNDFVTEVDRRAEQEIIKTIHRAYPDHGIIAEESGNSNGNEFTWIIDPLDGTTNFLHGFPHYAVSIAVQLRDRIEHAVVYDPIKQEMFSASRGSGAQLNGRRIRVSKSQGLAGALIGTGFPFKDPRYLPAYLQMFTAISKDTSGIRRAGSAALDLAYVAAGRLDGFWEFGLNIWDIAAGVLLIEEAGGLVTELNGGKQFLQTGHIAAGNLKTCKALNQIIQPYIPETLR